MSLKDFARKKRVEVGEKGIIAAAKTGVQEATIKASKPIAQYRSTPIWDVDFDVCLVLDACRMDLWNELMKERERYDWQNQSEWSVGSASVEWINNTFSPEHSDQIAHAGYVTGNPHTAKQPTFGSYTSEAVYPLHTTEIGYLDEVWADQWHIDEYETVRPEILTERGFYAWQHRDEYDIDQLIVHYMQPHIPFRNGLEWSTGWDNVLAFGEARDTDEELGDWQKLQYGKIPETEFWKAYKDNLQWVLTEVDRWISQTDARLLITSDHGNAMGEWGIWGHPPGIGSTALREVPWVVIEGNGTSSVEVEPRGNPPELATENTDVKERLEALGYR